MKADLHVHTLASGDSDLSLEAAFQLAREKGLAAIALTEHDTVECVGEAMTMARLAHVSLVPGVEISCSFCGSIAHLLAYSDGIECAKIREFLDGEHFEAMRRRLWPTIDFLRGRGVPISRRACDEEVARTGKNGSPLARALIRNGYVRDSADYQARVAAMLPRGIIRADWAPPLKRAVDVVNGCGALAVLAHPGVDHEGSRFFRLLEENVSDLLETGVGGLEAHHPAHTPERIRFWGYALRSRGCHML